MADDTFDITIQLPQQLAEVFASPEETRTYAHRALVLELLRDAHISQGMAARLLGITRWDIIELMGEYNILSGPATPEELREEVEAALRYRKEAKAGARR